MQDGVKQTFAKNIIAAGMSTGGFGIGDFGLRIEADAV